MISILHTFDLQIMEAFKVAPFDQNLCLNGLYLTDSSQTLGQLRVLPKSLIYLRADEPNPGASVMEPDDGWAMQHPEEGFKGEIRFLHFFLLFLKCLKYPNFWIDTSLKLLNYTFFSILKCA